MAVYGGGGKKNFPKRNGLVDGLLHLLNVNNVNNDLLTVEREKKVKCSIKRYYP